MLLVGDRVQSIIQPLNMSGCGLEVAPYFNPIALKSKFNVLYTDYISTEEIRAKAATNPGAAGGVDVPEVDYVWTPGKPLRDCISDSKVFDYAIASHVIEHVPNVIGWVNDILSVMKTGAVLALCVPDKRKTVDFYRHETSLGELIGAWVESRPIPTPSQIFDYLGQTFYDVGVRPAPFDLGVPFEKVERPYSDVQALEYAVNCYNEQTYLDVHCTSWSPNSFTTIFQRLAAMGLVNVSVSEPLEPDATGWHEFIVHLTKLGEPRVKAPAPTANALAGQPLDELIRDRDHARAAFAECAAMLDAVNRKKIRARIARTPLGAWLKQATTAKP
jgi:hypothetical protein